MNLRNVFFRAFILLLLGLAVFPCYAQDLGKKITLQVRDMTLEQILGELTRSQKVYFSYNPDILPRQQKMTFDFRRQPLRVILDEVLRKNGLDYQVTENQVVLKPMPKPLPAPAANTVTPRQKFTVSGYIRDKNSGEVLIGANVFIKETREGTVTNAYGFYSLSLPGGTYPLVVSFIGYKSEIQQVTLNKNLLLTMDLEEAKTEVGEVEISSDQGATASYLSGTGSLQISARTLSQVPGFAGETDVIKALQSFPGIISYGDGSALFYVRGGSSDQNLLLIDEAPLYNPAHLFGFFSAIAPDVISDVQAWKGDFPAGFGGRLSSVIDIHTRDGNMKKRCFSGNLGPFASGLTLEGPVVKDKASFLISARRSNLNWVKPEHTSIRSFSMNFYDLNGKVNYAPGPADRFFLSFYAGRDKLGSIASYPVATYGIGWDNEAGTLRWNHVFNHRLFANLTACMGQYHYYLYLSEDKDDYWESSIANLSLKTGFTWYLNPRNTLKWGAEAGLHHSDPGNVTLSDKAAEAALPAISQYRSAEYVFYADDAQTLWNILKIRYGLRVPLWLDLGPAKVYIFNVSHQVIDTNDVGRNVSYASFLRAEPKLDLTCRLGPHAGLRAGYDQTTQFIQLLSGSVSPFTSLEVWAPAGPNIQPQTAEQYMLGFFREFPQPGLTLSAEAYKRNFGHHIDYKDHANMLYNALIEGELRFGNATAYGFELMLRKTAGRLKGWISYTWSCTRIKTPEVNGGKEYPAFYDRPHDLSLNLDYAPAGRWSFCAAWYYRSGGAFTMPAGFYNYNGYSVPVYGDRNNGRLPDYHRLDFSVAFRLSSSSARYQQRLVLSVYNAYGRLNPFCYSYNKGMNDNGDFVVPVDMDGHYTLVPTALSVAGIIPSLNYTFKF